MLSYYAYNEVIESRIEKCAYEKFDARIDEMQKQFASTTLNLMQNNFVDTLNMIVKNNEILRKIPLEEVLKIYTSYKKESNESK